MVFLLTACSSNTAIEDTKATSEPVPEITAEATESTVMEEVAKVTDATTAPVEETVTTEVPTEETEATEVPTEETIPFEIVITPVITEKQTQVTVTTANEFIAAIAPNTEIIVNADLIDFSKASGYGTASGEYYRWVETFDGPELYITGVSNLTIRGSGEDHNANVLSAVPRYANVLVFENCSNIWVTGLTAGHTKEPGYCTGGVLYFLNSQDILVEDCGLFGCGTIGVNGYSCKKMQIINNDIYECSVAGVEFTNCDDVNVDGNTFRDIGGPNFRVYGCGIITCNGERVHDFSPRH